MSRHYKEHLNGLMNGCSIRINDIQKLHKDTTHACSAYVALNGDDANLQH